MVAVEQATRILVVEDDKDTALTLSKWLNLHGYETLAACSRDDAALMIGEFAPDVIFLDYWMTGMTASVFVHRIRKQLPKTKIIVISAAASAPSLAKVLGADAWFGKPLDFAAIENFLTHTV